VALSLVDTAGHEMLADGIDHEAQKRRQEQLDEADLVIWCQPADQRPGRTSVESHIALRKQVLPVVTKCDLGLYTVDSSTLAVSAHHGTGLRELAGAIAARLSRPAPGARQFLGTTAARSSDSLIKAQAALDRALAIARSEVDQELLAIEVREALEELGKIAGAIYTDDILDRIFSRFCIGK
jgi:tRNA modification GTPase